MVLLQHLPDRTKKRAVVVLTTTSMAFLTTTTTTRLLLLSSFSSSCQAQAQQQHSYREDGAVVARGNKKNLSTSTKEKEEVEDDTITIEQSSSLGVLLLRGGGQRKYTHPPNKTKKKIRRRRRMRSLEEEENVEEKATTNNNMPSLLPTTTLPPVHDKQIFETTLESSVSYAGNMFDIKAKENLLITSLGFHTSIESDYMKILLYTRYGSYVDCDKDITQWTLQADVVIQGQGMNTFTYIPEGAFDPILVRRKETLAIYITTDQANMRASKGIEEGKKYIANSDMILYEGVGKRYPIDRATFGPRVWNGAIVYGVVENLPSLAPTTLIPTYLPTMEPSIPPTKAEELLVKNNAFRLRLYWEKGFMWQETNDEFWWCMECRDSCLDGDSVYVDVCDTTSIGQQFTFVENTIRPAYDTSLCLTTMGYTSDTPMKFMTCKENSSDQKFEGMTTEGKFELHPKGDSDRCVSQNHHPKSFERVYPEKCSLTRINDTNCWITY